MSMIVETNLLEIIKAFPEFGKYIGYKPVSEGHINDTYIVEYEMEDGSVSRYLLQRINVNVFKKPVELMENVCGVTSFLREKIKENGGDPTRETLTVYPAKDGKNYYMAEDGGCWRVYNFVDNTFTINELTSAEDFRNAALSFGNFANLLADYPIETLHDTIPNFHNTPSRFNDLKIAVENNASGRKDNALPEIEFAFAREKDCSVITDLLGTEKVPLKVTHNDTKLNNVLFSVKTGEAICAIDLDTVMPGLSAYDFGDAIRSGANRVDEDKAKRGDFSMKFFEAYARGYINNCASVLTQNERDVLASSACLLTFECGMRFLHDYIDGDKYFRVEHTTHNLQRAISQFNLVADMEAKLSQMEKVIKELVKNTK